MVHFNVILGKRLLNLKNCLFGERKKQDYNKGKKKQTIKGFIKRKNILTYQKGNKLRFSSLLFG